MDKVIRQIIGVSLFFLGSQLYSQETNYSLIKLDSLSGEELWNKIIEENKGKVIYGDLCGSWCAPCEYYFSLSDSLHHEYEETNVSFIYLWYRSKEESAIKLIETYKLVGNHYLLEKDQGDSIQKKFNNFGFPCYFLVNRIGELTYINAPRPGSKVIFKHIDKLLEN